MKRKKLAQNTVASLVFQMTAIICGFVLPRLILSRFGSEINGLVNSISQFLNVICFLELGVAAVVESSLYKPLAEMNEVLISKIMVSANKFFKGIGKILAVYVIILMFGYHYIANQNFGHMYTALLIAAMSISSFAQYYCGIVDKILLSADQRGYLFYTAQTLTMIVNTILCSILIKLDCSIQMVKLATSLVYLIRPIVLRMYVNSHYSINRLIMYNAEPIKQKWSGIAQHIAAIILEGTDSIVLTIFATLKDVSIYNVYYIVVYGLRSLIVSISEGFQSLLGEYIAKGNIDKAKLLFGWFEWGIHTAVVFIFGCTYILICPFVLVYVKGINDANYYQPVFAALMVLSYAFFCIRTPYFVVIKSGGHYRETQQSFVVAMIINLTLSILMVKVFGLIGVVLGTLIAMAYQTFWMAYYCSKNILIYPFQNFIKQLLVDILTMLLGIMVTKKLEMDSINLISWIIFGIRISSVWVVVVLIVNLIFYRSRIYYIFLKFTAKYQYGKKNKV